MRRLLVVLTGMVFLGPLLPSAAGAVGTADAEGLASVRSYRSSTTGRYRNLFAEVGVSNRALDARIAAVWNRYRRGGPDQRVVQRGADRTAYIVDLNHDDVRSEGMSYGMMIAVQLGDRPTFDALWRWTERNLLRRDGPYEGLLAWHARPDGTVIDENPAPDGDQWAAMALLFAANRWRDAPASAAYRAAGWSLLRALRARAFDADHHQVVFSPVKGLNRYTDPSYHLPAFYTLWAQWAPTPEESEFWSTAAETSRSLLDRAAHPATGLAPDYAHFDGTPLKGPNGRFGADAWRVIANVALDHALFGADPAQQDQADRLLRFFAGEGLDSYGDGYALAGERTSPAPRPPALIAMNATAALAADPGLGRPFVRALWNTRVPTGQGRYYDGLLYLLGLLYAGGRFRVHGPA